MKMCGGIWMDSRFDCPYVIPSIGSPHFTADPDLLILREDIADEVGAIVGYLECATQIKDYRISAQFRETADDEMGHSIRLMRMLAVLDPVQAEESKKQGLAMLNGANETGLAYSIAGKCQGCNQPEGRRHDYSSKKMYPPDEHVLECLKNALRDELHAINAYQKQILATANPVIQNLLTTIMNKEKEHVSQFTRLFYDLYDG
jgi:rubrerythrin